MLSNMFDPTTETETGWEHDIRDDVLDECNKFGDVLHLHVDTVSPQVGVASVHVTTRYGKIPRRCETLHMQWSSLACMACFLSELYSY